MTRPKAEDVKTRVCTRNVFLCHVIGPEGAGKSSFLQGLLGRTVKDLRSLDHVNELSRYAINTLNYRGHNKYLLVSVIAGLIRCVKKYSTFYSKV